MPGSPFLFFWYYYCSLKWPPVSIATEVVLTPAIASFPCGFVLFPLTQSLSWLESLISIQYFSSKLFRTVPSGSMKAAGSTFEEQLSFLVLLCYQKSQCSRTEIHLFSFIVAFSSFSFHWHNCAWCIHSISPDQYMVIWQSVVFCFQIHVPTLLKKWLK